MVDVHCAREQEEEAADRASRARPGVAFLCSTRMVAARLSLSQQWFSSCLLPLVVLPPDEEGGEQSHGQHSAGYRQRQAEGAEEGVAGGRSAQQAEALLCALCLHAAAGPRGQVSNLALECACTIIELVDGMRD